MTHSTRHRLFDFAFVALVLAVFGGCTRAPEPVFVASDDLAELPELHQENIQSNLRDMFGVPNRPRLNVTLAEQDAESDAEQELEDADGETQSEDETAAVDGARLAILNQDRLLHGAAVYGKRCSGCHGSSGDGKGPAAKYLQPRPRDYRKGIFKFTSTPYGARPARQDLVRTIRRGAKGTSMPAFPWMSKEDLDAVIDYVIYLSLRGQVEGQAVSLSDDYDEDEDIDPEEFSIALESEVKKWEDAESIVVNPVSAEPAYDLESIKLGRTLFIKSSCYNCHGTDAKGQTEWLSPEFILAQADADAENKIQINFDSWGDPAPAANITARMLHGGRRPLDVYRRIYTGINGTPMPQFGPVFAENPDAIWHMVHYVMHIVDGGDPIAGISLAEFRAAEAAEAEQAANRVKPNDAEDGSTQTTEAVEEANNDE